MSLSLILRSCLVLLFLGATALQSAELVKINNPRCMIQGKRSGEKKWRNMKRSTLKRGTKVRGVRSKSGKLFYFKILGNKKWSFRGKYACILGKSPAVATSKKPPTKSGNKKEEKIEEYVHKSSSISLGLGLFVPGTVFTASGYWEAYFSKNFSMGLYAMYLFSEGLNLKGGAYLKIYPSSSLYIGGFGGSQLSKAGDSSLLILDFGGLAGYKFFIDDNTSIGPEIQYFVGKPLTENSDFFVSIGSSLIFNYHY